LTYKDAVKHGYIVPVEAYYIDCVKIPVAGYKWPEVYKEIVVNNENRNAQIAGMLYNLQIANKSTLCLVKEIAHGNALAELTNIPFANGVSEETPSLIKQFNNKEIPILIGTEGVLSEGIDTKPCEYVLITGLGKAKSRLMQAVGRAVRRHPGKETAKVVLFRDKSHKWSLQHYAEQAKIMKEVYGVIPQKLEVL
jgi:superfamily II DNA or RNA helicase